MRITDNIFFKRDYGAGTFLEIGIATALPCTFSLNDMRALLYGCQISSVRKKDLIVRYVPGTPEFEANKVKVGQHVQVDRRKIKVKLGPIICAFETTLVAKIEKDAETYLEKEYYNVLYELNDAVRYEREFSQAYHLYSVIYPILVKARMANGSYKLVGKANTKQELISLIEPAKQTSDFDFGIEGLGSGACANVETYISGLNPGSVMGTAGCNATSRCIVISGDNYVSCNTAPN